MWAQCGGHSPLHPSAPESEEGVWGWSPEWGGWPSRLLTPAPAVAAHKTKDSQNSAGVPGGGVQGSMVGQQGCGHWEVHCGVGSMQRAGNCTETPHPLYPVLHGMSIPTPCPTPPSPITQPVSPHAVPTAILPQCRLQPVGPSLGLLTNAWPCLNFQSSLLVGLDVLWPQNLGTNCLGC